MCKYITGNMDNQKFQEFNNSAGKGVLTALELLYEKYDWGVTF